MKGIFGRFIPAAAVVGIMLSLIFVGEIYGQEYRNARQLSEAWLENGNIEDYDFGAVLREYFDTRCMDFKSPSLSYNKNSYSVIMQEEIQKRHNLVRAMEEEYNLVFLDACNALYIQGVEYGDNSVNVRLKEWIFYDYDDLSDDRVNCDTSGFGTDHSLVLLHTQKGYIISEDTYDESDVTGMRSVFYTVPEDMEPALDNEVNSLNAYGNYTYSPDRAAEYADTYWLNYNPAYSDYNSVGGDCANFVSQAIEAGGMPMDENWFWRSYSDRSSSWTYVPDQRKYFAAKGKLIDNPDQSQVKKGNPVWYLNSSGTRYSHAAICVGTNSAGTPIVDAHNSDRYHVHWQLGGTKYWGGFSTVLLNASDTTTDTLPITGDINTDGKVTADDSALILQKVLDNAFITSCETAYPDLFTKLTDVSGDSIITAEDASLVLQKSINNAFIFPCER